MLFTSTSSSQQKEPLRVILERIAQPLFLFSLSLFGLLFLSWAFLTPRFTQFQVADVTLSPTEMVVYAKQLQAKVSAIEEKRDRLILPNVDPVYGQLKTEKREVITSLTIREDLLSAAGQLSAAGARVTLTSLTLDPDMQKVTFSGEIGNVGLSSMTVLAQYVDTIEHLPMVSHLVRPSFSRVQKSDDTFVSPFTMSFTLVTPKQ